MTIMIQPICVKSGSEHKSNTNQPDLLSSSLMFADLFSSTSECTAMNADADPVSFSGSISNDNIFVACWHELAPLYDFVSGQCTCKAASVQSGSSCDAATSVSDGCIFSAPLTNEHTQQWPSQASPFCSNNVRISLKLTRVEITDNLPLRVHLVSFSWSSSGSTCCCWQYGDWKTSATWFLSDYKTGLKTWA